MELLAENSEEISAHVRALGWIGAGQSITSLASAGAGNMNRTLRASLDMPIDSGTRSIILKQSVPFVAKYPQIPAPENRIDIEARFYGAIAGVPGLSSRVPRILGYDPENRLLCLEDLGAAQDFTDMYAGRPAAGSPSDSQRSDHLRALIGWLAQLHALPLTADRLPNGLDNRAMRELNHEHIFEIPLQPDNGLDLDPALLDIAVEFAADANLKTGARALGDLYLGRANHESPDVLLHGDFYPGSWLQHETTGAVVIDPEFAFVGAPEFDVGVFLGHLTMCGYPQAEAVNLMRSYDAAPGFNDDLAWAFAGIEIIRRLLGVAQLPLVADAASKLAWLIRARELLSTRR